LESRDREPRRLTRRRYFLWHKTIADEKQEAIAVDDCVYRFLRLHSKLVE
jgi:hypothetical protein